jgi:hypothetical protein
LPQTKESAADLQPQSVIDPDLAEHGPGPPADFDPAADGGHKMLRMFAKATGKAPRKV